MEDVRALMSAARALASRPALVSEIAASTGLSRPGVELALAEHLELDATDEELRRLVARAGSAARVWVILSSNVFVGALRALAIARAASTDVVVRPSRRDPAFARALVAEAADPALRLVTELDVGELTAGELHVYGHDATIRELRARARPCVRVVGHGSGMGVAWISRGAALEAAARDLARDVVAFDQRGCLSPRVACVEGPLARADAFADALHEALERLEERVPRGALPPEERAASERYVTTMTYAHRALVGTAHVVGVAPPEAALVAAPTYRHVHLVPCASEEAALRVLDPLRPAIVAVSSDEAASARRLAPPWARTSALGSMQRPPLDGPVDLRES